MFSLFDALICARTDPDAQLLYLYLPICVTLIANLLFLVTARHIRTSRLRRLELGAKHHKRHGGSGEDLRTLMPALELITERKKLMTRKMLSGDTGAWVRTR